MKKLLALMVAILFSVTVYAQDKEKKMEKKVKELEGKGTEVILE